MMRHCIRPSAAATSGFPQKSSIVKRDATTQEKTRQGYPVHVVDNAVGSSRRARNESSEDSGLDRSRHRSRRGNWRCDKRNRTVDMYRHCGMRLGWVGLGDVLDAEAV